MLYSLQIRQFHLVRLASLVALAPAIAMAAGCGSRGPLETTGPGVTPGANLPDAGGNVVVDSSATEPANPADAAPERVDANRSNPIDCVVCVGQKCGDSILGCLRDQTCRTTLQCVLTNCVQGTTPDLSCALTCANGDVGQLAMVAGVVQCVFSQCGSDCTSLLERLGGLGGGGSGGGGEPGDDDGPPPPPRRDGGRGGRGDEGGGRGEGGEPRMQRSIESNSFLVCLDEEVGLSPHESCQLRE